MMNLVIRSSVTPYSKSCRGVMSLRGPLVSCPHRNRDHRYQSSERLPAKADFCLKAHLFLDFFFSGVQSREPAFSSHAERACARAGVAGCRQHAVRTMNSKPPTNTAAIERKHTVRQGCGARTHAITDVEWVQWHLTPASQTPINTVHPRRSVHDSAIICFPPSDLHAVMSRHYFLLLHC